MVFEPYFCSYPSSKMDFIIFLMSYSFKILKNDITFPPITKQNNKNNVTLTYSPQNTSLVNFMAIRIANYLCIYKNPTNLSDCLIAQN